jgi:hypothetical protein
LLDLPEVSLHQSDEVRLGNAVLRVEIAYPEAATQEAKATSRA